MFVSLRKGDYLKILSQQYLNKMKQQKNFLELIKKKLVTGYLKGAWKNVFVHNQFSPVSKSAILNLIPPFLMFRFSISSLYHS